MPQIEVGLICMTHNIRSDGIGSVSELIKITGKGNHVWVRDLRDLWDITDVRNNEMPEIQFQTQTIVFPPS